MFDINGLVDLILNYVDSVYIIIFALSVGVNLVIPASSIIIYFIVMYAPDQAFFYSQITLLMASLMVFAGFFPVKHVLRNKIPDSYAKALSYIEHNESVMAAFIVRLSPMPYVVQNLICSHISKNIYIFLSVNFFVTSVWFTFFLFFYEALVEFEILFVVIFLVAFFIISRHVKNVIYKFK